MKKIFSNSQNRFLSGNFKIKTDLIENQLKNDLIRWMQESCHLNRKISKEKALVVINENNWETIKAFTEDDWGLHAENKGFGFSIYNKVKKIKRIFNNF